MNMMGSVPRQATIAADQPLAHISSEHANPRPPAYGDDQAARKRVPDDSKPPMSDTLAFGVFSLMSDDVHAMAAPSCSRRTMIKMRRRVPRIGKVALVIAESAHADDVPIFHSRRCSAGRCHAGAPPCLVMA